MKIGIAGTQCIGKTTFCNDFVSNWDMYKFDKHKYVTKKNSDKLNRNGDEESQMAILNTLVDQITTTKRTNVIYDRTPLDNLAYTLWLNSADKVSDEFVKKTIDIVGNSLPLYDLIFFMPITKHSPVKIEKKKNRDCDGVYRNEIDYIFKSLMGAYLKGSTVYFPIDYKLGRCPIIEMYGDREQRIQLSKFYVKDNGKAFSEEESLIKDLEVAK